LERLHRQCGPPLIRIDKTLSGAEILSDAGAVAPASADNVAIPFKTRLMATF